MATGDWGSKKNGVRLGCFYTGMELSADGSQARITGAIIKIDRDVNISDSTNNLSWSGNAVTNGSDSNINVSGSGEKTIKSVTGRWNDLTFGATSTHDFVASMSGIDYAGGTISNTYTVTYPARAWLIPVAPTNVYWVQNSPGNFSIYWANKGSGTAPYQSLVLVRNEVGGPSVGIAVAANSGSYNDAGLALNKQYNWYLYASNSSGTSYSGTTSNTPIPLHTFTLSSYSVNIDGSVTFYIEKYGSSNTSSIYFLKSGVWTIVLDRSSATSFTYTFTKEDWAIFLSDTTSRSFSVVLNTFSGDTYLGGNSSAITINIPDEAPYQASSVAPTVTEQIANVQTVFGTGVYVKNQSKIRFSWLGSAGYSASVVKKEILVTRSWVAGTSAVDVTATSIYEEIPSGSGTITVATRTTDSRGRVAVSTNVVKTVYDYTAPTITTFLVSRCDAAGNANHGGTYVKFTINVAASSINPGSEANQMQYRIRVLDATGNETGSDIYAKALNATLTSNIITAAIGGSYSSQSGYSFKLTLNDDLTNINGTAVSKTASISSEVYPLSIGTNGIAIGKVYNDSTLAIDVVGKTSGIIPVGAVQMYAGSAVPDGWLMCDGASFSPTTYPKLYTTIGTTYGGTSVAPLTPNLKGRIPVGKSSETEFDTLGETGGEKAHTLTVTEMPNHDHGAWTVTGGVDHYHSGTTAGETQEHTHGPGNLTGYYDMRSVDDSGTTYHGATQYIFSAFDRSSESGTVHINGGATGGRSAQHNHTFSTGGASAYAHQHGITAQGGGGAHNNLQPYIVLNYIIKAV